MLYSFEWDEENYHKWGVYKDLEGGGSCLSKKYADPCRENLRKLRNT